MMEKVSQFLYFNLDPQKDKHPGTHNHSITRKKSSYGQGEGINNSNINSDKGKLQ